MRKHGKQGCKHREYGGVAEKERLGEREKREEWEILLLEM